MCDIRTFLRFVSKSKSFLLSHSHSSSFSLCSFTLCSLPSFFLFFAFPLCFSSFSFYTLLIFLSLSLPCLRKETTNLDKRLNDNLSWGGGKTYLIGFKSSPVSSILFLSQAQIGSSFLCLNPCGYKNR